MGLTAAVEQRLGAGSVQIGLGRDRSSLTRLALVQPRHRRRCCAVHLRARKKNSTLELDLDLNRLGGGLLWVGGVGGGGG